jgi:hydroxymethylbilane synthase
VIGSRGSKLAVIQAESVAVKIKQRYPHLNVTVSKIVTQGDRDKVTRLDTMDPSVFVKELEAALLTRKIDIAVHSLKDLPTGLVQGLCLLAVTERIDPRDVLVTRCGALDTLPPGSTIGTDSLRRRFQIANYRSDLKICNLRGNTDTRLRKVSEGEIDALVMAASAIIRLRQQDQIAEFLSTDYFLPSAGQGAIGIEARLDDSEIRDLVSPLNDFVAWKSCLAERQFIRLLGFGCRAPLGALATVEANRLRLDSMIFTRDTNQIHREYKAGDINDAEEIGTSLAQKVIQMRLSLLTDEVDQ